MNEEKIRKIAEQVFQDQLQQSQYQVTSVPAHIHNQTDSPHIPPTSVTNFVPLSAVNKDTSATSGVLSTNNISIAEPPYGVIYPIPVIRGVGVGPFSQFNGGDAPLGSMVLFLTGVVFQLWVMLEDGSGNPQWSGVNLPLTA